jgi:predicted GIY-YIG superfamily endonuclease
MNDNNYYVYIIKGVKNNKTKFYIGCTNDLTRRLKQHNRILKGGAKATSGDYTWNYMGLLSNIPNNISALQIEYRIKHSTKKTNIISRIEAFLEYLEQNNKPSPNAEIFDYKILFSLNEELYNKINKKNEWSNIIIIEENDFSSICQLK